MLELIQQENCHGLTVYVAVRVAIVLICWVFLAMATFIDMYYGRKAAKRGRGSDCEAGSTAGRSTKSGTTYGLWYSPSCLTS